MKTRSSFGLLMISSVTTFAQIICPGFDDVACLEGIGLNHAEALHLATHASALFRESAVLVSEFSKTAAPSIKSAGLQAIDDSLTQTNDAALSNDNDVAASLVPGFAHFLSAKTSLGEVVLSTVDVAFESVIIPILQDKISIENTAAKPQLDAFAGAAQDLLAGTNTAEFDNDIAVLSSLVPGSPSHVAALAALETALGPLNGDINQSVLNSAIFQFKNFVGGNVATTTAEPGLMSPIMATAMHSGGIGTAGPSTITTTVTDLETKTKVTRLTSNTPRRPSTITELTTIYQETATGVGQKRGAHETSSSRAAAVPVSGPGGLALMACAGAAAGIVRLAYGL